MAHDTSKVVVLDHLMPAFGATYSSRGVLDDLPVGVWLTSNIIPMVLMSAGDEPEPRLEIRAHGKWRASRPDDFRYRVIHWGRARRVEVYLKKDDAHVEPDEPFFTIRNRGVLPTSQHQAFASTARIDPKQDWKPSSFFDDLGLGPALLGVFATRIVLPGALLYWLYRRHHNTTDKRG